MYLAKRPNMMYSAESAHYQQNGGFKTMNADQIKELVMSMVMQTNITTVSTVDLGPYREDMVAEMIEATTRNPNFYTHDPKELENLLLRFMTRAVQDKSIKMKRAKIEAYARRVRLELQKKYGLSGFLTQLTDSELAELKNTSQTPRRGSSPVPLVVGAFVVILFAIAGYFIAKAISQRRQTTSVQSTTQVVPAIPPATVTQKTVASTTTTTTTTNTPSDVDTVAREAVKKVETKVDEALSKANTALKQSNQNTVELKAVNTRLTQRSNPTRRTRTTRQVASVGGRSNPGSLGVVDCTVFTSRAERNVKTVFTTSFPPGGCK